MRGNGAQVKHLAQGVMNMLKAGATMYALVVIALYLQGCTHAVTPDDPSECWRYGVAMDNTGRMSATPLDEIPVVKLGYDELMAACGTEAEDGLEIRACYDPMTDTIYTYGGDVGDRFINHERCHVMLGREHNSCYGKGYAQWGEDIQSACEWDL